MAGTPIDRTGIVIPPPLLFGVPLIAGWLIGRSAERRLLASDRVALVVGFVLLIAGAAVAISGVFEFRRAHTTVLPFGGTSRIVDTGIYRWTRYPMYLGMALAYAGAAVLLNSLWCLVLLPVAMLLAQSFAIRYEERYLAAKFGDGYERYRREVRRWL
jgi:protein-S-isoprenylcysteine O-methyltransferase Ste14